MDRLSVLVALLLLGGCAAYDPPMAGDHTAMRYQADLQRCRKQASADAARVANATPQSAIRALFTSNEPQREQVRTCMVARGHHFAAAP